MLAWLWRLSDGPQHSIIAAGFMLVFGGLAWALGQPHPAVLGALAGIVWFHGREVADADSVNRSLLNNPAGLLPWRWHRDSIIDFAWPLGTNTALAAFVEVVT